MGRRASPKFGSPWGCPGTGSLGANKRLARRTAIGLNSRDAPILSFLPSAEPILTLTRLVACRAPSRASSRRTTLEVNRAVTLLLTSPQDMLRPWQAA